MPGYRIVYGGPSPRTGLAIGFVDVLFFALLIAVMLSLGAPEMITLVVIFVGLPLSLVFAYIIARNIAGKAQKAKAILGLISGISGDEIVFKRPVEYSIGYIETVGYWYSTGRSRHYRYKTNYSVVDKGSADRINLKPLLEKGYSILADRSGDGYMLLPALMIEEPEYHGVGIVLIPWINKFQEFEASLNVYHQAGDMGSANLRVSGDKLSGSINYARKAKSRKLRLELEGIYENAPVLGKITRTVRIKTLKNPGGESVEYQLNPHQQLAIVMAGKINPYRIILVAKRAGVDLGKVILYGYNRGRYYLKLVLDLPFRKDVVDKKEIVLKPASTEAL